MSAWTPAKKLTVSSYIENAYPDAFAKSDVGIMTVLPERTFWEKAAILHKEAFRENGSMPKRYSRHYYDVYALEKSEVKGRAFNDTDLLKRVVSFTERFYRSAFAHYELAKPGTFRMLPPKSSLLMLEQDYAAMRGMIFGEYPPFAKIIGAVKALQDEINSL